MIAGSVSKARAHVMALTKERVRELGADRVQSGPQRAFDPEQLRSAEPGCGETIGEFAGGVEVRRGKAAPQVVVSGGGGAEQTGEAVGGDAPLVSS
jgi:hypothetical protein